MADLDAYTDVLGSDVRAVWPILAKAVKNIRGSLVGGTALAMHLRHRISYDLDYMAYKSFSGEHLYRGLRAAAGTARADSAVKDQMNAVIDGVAVGVFMAPHRGDNPGHVKQLHKPMIVDGLAVASLPDLLATKLDIIMYRPKLRDYIDIAAIDASGRLRIEDGLALHMQRYGTTLRSQTLDRIINLLEKPGQLSADKVFAFASNKPSTTSLAASRNYVRTSSTRGWASPRIRRNQHRAAPQEHQPPSPRPGPRSCDSSRPGPRPPTRRSPKPWAPSPGM